MKFDNAVELSGHVRENHFKDQISQTIIPKVNKFPEAQGKSETYNSKYSCFYCGYFLSSEENVKKHRLECHEPYLGFKDNIYSQTYLQPLMLPLSTYPPSFPWPTEFSCYTCYEKFKTKVYLREHYNSSHPDIILFWCDVCLTNFGSERGLQSHMRNEHKIFS